MKTKLLATAVSLGLAMPVITEANTSSLSIEQRLALLEQRTLAAEKRAELAEQKAANLEKALQNRQVINQPINNTTATTNHTEAPHLIETNSQYGKLKLYGDVEFNTDVASKKGN